jgi:hypothetical protein
MSSSFMDNHQQDTVAYFRLSQIAVARQRRTLERLRKERAELEWRLINLERKYLLDNKK